MDKINFENLPSTKTPVSAENLNDMQSNIEKSVVAVGSTQPSTTEKVWIKTGENVEKEILVKNSNGVFEKFYNEEEINQENYSLEEHKIGTWIDGKPLYRKVIKLNTIDRNSDNTSYSISTPNLKEVIDIRGSVTTDFGAVKPLNHFYINNDTIATHYSCSLYSFDSSSLQLVYGRFIAERFSFANVIVEYTKN